jgi:4-amino-4-deoxy-L-arabinose transferase-like glycosyltransferase
VQFSLARTRLSAGVGVARGLRSLEDPRRLLVPTAGLLALAGGAVTEMERRRAHGVGNPPVVSWVLFAMAAAALVFSATRGTRRRLASPPPFGALRQTIRPSAATMFVAAFLCSAASVPVFIRLNDSNSAVEAGWAANNASWLLYAASLALFAVGVAIYARRGRAARDGAAPAGWPETLPRRTELVILSVLTAVALALRLPALQTIPHGLWLDEAQNGLVGKELLAPGALHKVFVPDLTTMGSLYYYLLGAILELLGSSVWVLRLLPALAGSLTVPLLYLLAARLFGWRTGLAAGALLAVSGWSITFSRFGMASMVAVALDVAIVLCVVVGLRSGRLGWYAAGGILLGINMQGYFLARLLPIVLLLLVAHLAFGSRRELWRLRSGIAIFSTAAALAFLPMGLFVIQHPSEFQSRPTTVSIFSAEGSGGQSNAVWKSLRRHLLMFNYQGDFNGRHNLPGSPMLDWLTGALFFSGLCVCLLRLRRWEYFLPVVWFAAELCGGVFTYLGEAPQSHRSLENSVVTPLIAGIFVGGGWSVLVRGGRSRKTELAAGVAVLAAIVAATVMNVEKYFGRQADDPIVWAAMGADKLELGRLVRDNSRRDEVWVSDTLADQPALRFLAPGTRPLLWGGEEDVPFAGANGRDVVLVLDPSRWTDMAAVNRLYPDAKFEVYRARDHTPLLYSVFVPARDIEATHGVLELSPGRSPVRQATYTTDGQGTSQVRLLGTVDVPFFARYRFAWHGRPGRSARIVIDGRLAPRDWSPLSSGLHSVEVDVSGERGKASLLWATQGSTVFQPVGAALVFDPRRVWPVGLEGDYRDGSDFRGRVRLARIDPQIGIIFHELPVSPPFTVDWRGELYAPAAGSYVVGTKQVDTARLFVDGRPLLDNTDRGVLHEAPIHLTEGWHRLRIMYQALGAFFNCFLYWTPPGEPTSVVPSAYLRPSSASVGFPRSSKPTLAQSNGELPPGRLLEAGEP